MKIGPVNLSRELESHIPSNYFGFIEVEPEWEDELAKLENGTHYGVKGSARNTNVFQYLQKQYKEMLKIASKNGVIFEMRKTQINSFKNYWMM